MRGKMRAQCAASSFHHPFHFRGCHEGPVLPEVGEDPPPRLQGGPPPWQGLRDLQVESAFQSAPALKHQARRPETEACPKLPALTSSWRNPKGRSDAAFLLPSPRRKDAPSARLLAVRSAKTQQPTKPIHRGLRP